MADYDLIEGFNYNLSMDDFNIKSVGISSLLSIVVSYLI